MSNNNEQIDNIQSQNESQSTNTVNEIVPISQIEFDILFNRSIETKSSIVIASKITCENPECAKGYDKKATSAYGMDFCSGPCCRKVVDPIREKERAKEEERIAKNKYLGNLNYGGGGGAR